MAPLTIKRRSVHTWMQYEIRGFTLKELDELKSMEYRDLLDTIVEILDDRNDGFGTVLRCVIGIYHVGFGDDAVLIKANTIVRRG